MKRCSGCKTEKPLTAFTLDKSRKDGKGRLCRPCATKRSTQWVKDHPEVRRVWSRAYYRKNCEKIKAAVKAHRNKHPDRTRDTYLRWQYGISLAEYNAMWKAQSGECAICKTPQGRGRNGFHVDHDHVTGKVRGLLCRDCNYILGNAKDSPQLLQRAIEYLQKHI